jgi:hypothetical protein
MKVGSEKAFGAGYNVLPVWKRRLDAKTLVTTPNSDVIYAMSYIEMTQHYGLRPARLRALRIVAAYASIRELSETEFCRLVDDLTIASVAMAPSADDPLIQ